MCSFNSNFMGSCTISIDKLLSCILCLYFELIGKVFYKNYKVLAAIYNIYNSLFTLQQLYIYIILGGCIT